MPLKGILSGLRHGTKNSQHPKKEKLLKNLLRTLRYGQHFIFMPVVTLVLINHPSYVCYLDLCFRCACSGCGAVLRWVAVPAQGEQLGAFARLAVFLGVFERRTRCVALCFCGARVCVPRHGSVF